MPFVFVNKLSDCKVKYIFLNYQKTSLKTLPFRKIVVSLHRNSNNYSFNKTILLMKQILRYSFVALLAMFVGTVFAQNDVVIDFNSMSIATSSSDNNAGDINETQKFVGDADENVVLFISAKTEEANNPNRFWQTNNGPQLRCYSGTITIQAKFAMKSITFDAPSKFDVSVNGEKMSSKVWNGDAKEVVFTVNANTQINKITISGKTSGETPGGETNYGTAEAPLTVAQAIAIANTAGSTATTEDVYTKGVVTKITTAWNSQYNNISFNISDDGGTTTLAVFRCKAEAEDYVLVGDEVVIKGKLKMYNDTPEYDANCEIVSLKQGDAHNKPVETPTAANIAAFIAMETGQKVILTLKDAQVIGVGNKYMIVKDATGALNLYNTNLTFTLGQILNGTITGQTAEYKTIKQLSSMSENTLTPTDGTITPTTVTVAQANSAETLSGVYKIENAVVQKDGNNFYIVDGETKLQLYNQFKYDGLELSEGTFNIEGIVGYYNNKQFWPNSISSASGISDVKAQEAQGVIYNLAGQRIEKAQKGIYIQNGKKFIVK